MHVFPSSPVSPPKVRFLQCHPPRASHFLTKKEVEVCAWLSCREGSLRKLVFLNPIVTKLTSRLKRLGGQRAGRGDNSLMLAALYPNTPFLAISWEKLSPTDFGVRTNSILLSLLHVALSVAGTGWCPRGVGPSHPSLLQALPFPAASLLDVPGGPAGLPSPLWITAM